MSGSGTQRPELRAHSAPDEEVQNSLPGNIKTGQNDMKSFGCFYKKKERIYAAFNISYCKRGLLLLMSCPKPRSSEFTLFDISHHPQSLTTR